MEEHWHAVAKELFNLNHKVHCIWGPILIKNGPQSAVKSVTVTQAHDFQWSN